MSLVNSIILGVVQGLTEFLPVSSSAHLKICKHFLQETEAGVLVDLSCHLGTLFALILFLRKDIWEILKYKKQILFFFLALIPLVPCYFLLKPLRTWASNQECLGPCLMLTGVILLAGQSLRVSRSDKANGTSKLDAIMIGTLQSAALVPGISRSAATISCARVLGWSPKQAVRFSFLLSIPTIIGGNLIELVKASSFSSADTTLPIFTLLSCFFTSFLVGIFVIKKAFNYLEKGNFKPLAYYVLMLGIFSTLYFTV